MFQTIQVGNKKLNLFFDSGCGNMVIRKSAVDSLMKLGLAKNILKGPLVLSGVACQKSICEFGKFQITLPLYNGENINLSGICLDKITSTFPNYPLGEVEKEIQQDYLLKGGDLEKLPKLPKSVGGETDIMLGIQYLRYFPTEIHKLSNGLSLFQSHFKSFNGTRGLVGGPHKSFNFVYKDMVNHVETCAYYSAPARVLKNHFLKSSDMGLLDIPKPKINSKFKNTFFATPGGQSKIQIDMINGFNDDNDMSYLKTCPPDGSTTLPQNTSPTKKIYTISKNIGFNDVTVSTVETYKTEKSIVNANVNKAVKKRVPKIVKLFEEVEKVGTEASYRCIKCRGCSDCKKKRVFN